MFMFFLYAEEYVVLRRYCLRVPETLYSLYELLFACFLAFLLSFVRAME